MDWKTLMRILKDQGWVVERRNGHSRAWPPNGGRHVVIPGTPSDCRAALNARAKLRRAGADL